MIGFVGGTGPEGRGLALRFALAGEAVAIGSRDAARAAEAAETILREVPTASVSAGLNEDIAGDADIVFVSVPHAAQRETLIAIRGQLAGKTVVTVVAPVSFSKGVAAAVPVEEGSAALQAKALLPDSKVAAAFQTISARDLLKPGKPVDSDVVVCANDEDAKAEVSALAEKIEGVRAVDGGGLDNAGYVENFTALLMNINRRYKAHSAIRIVGI